MAKALATWLATFIAAELEAVIGWNHQSQQTPKVKRDPDSRFSDDGSNFRSTATPPTLKPEYKLQLLQVVSNEGPAVVILADGTYSIKATLSDDALAALEAGLEESLADDTENDVINPISVTVRSTPYGLTEGRVQLFVETLQYQYHLRKRQGDPKPIVQSPEVERLLGQIRQIRFQQYPDGEADVESPAASQGAASQIGEPALQMPSKQATAQVFQSQAVLQTQAQPSQPQKPPKRRPGPSLAKDGFEVEGGINLAGPSGIGRTIPAKPGRQAKVTNASTLLSLMGGKGVVPEPAIETPVHVPSPQKEPDVVVEQPPKPKPKRIEKPATKTAPRKELATVELSSAQTKPATPAKRKAPSQKDNQPNGIPYGRRQIPDLQQRLLDRKDSWSPSLPGQRFPHPNVPIDLLRTWNAKVATAEAAAPPDSAATPASVRSEVMARNTSIKAIPTGTVLGTTENVSANESSSESSSDEEFLDWSQSPTQRPRQEMLPPDSTMAASGKSAAQASPRHLPIRHSPIKQPPSAVAKGLNGTPTGSEAMSRGPAASQSVDRRAKPLRTFRDGMPSGPRSTGSQYSPRAPSAAASQASMGSVQDAPRGLRATAPAQSSMQSPAKRPYLTANQSGNAMHGSRPGSSQHLSQQSPMKYPLPAKPPVPSSGLETVIKGTQYSAGGDDMEMEVPRQLEDPSILYRKRRSEHMRAAQRRQWLKENCVYKYTKGEYVSAICAEYAARFANDQPAPEELYPAMQDVFKDLDVSPQRGIKMKPAMPQKGQQQVRDDPQRQLDGVIEKRSQADESAADGERQQTVGQLAAVERPLSPAHAAQVNFPDKSLSATSHKAEEQPLKTTHAASATKSKEAPFGFRVKERPPLSSASTASAAQAPKANGTSFNIYGDQRLPQFAFKTENVGRFVRPKNSNPSKAAFATQPGSPAPRDRLPRPSSVQQEERTPEPKPTASRMLKNEQLDGALDPRGPTLVKQEDPVDESQATDTTPRSPISAFAEFRQAWQALKPGGAFALQQSDQQSRSPAYKINILSWDV